VIWIELFFLEKKAVLATARVPKPGMIIKLGPELHYFGDSGAKFKVQSSPDIEL
jgi:hypothetical protein